MAQPAGRRQTIAETPPLDPTAVPRAYRRERAKRRARVARRQAQRAAQVRFWATLVVLLGAAIFLSLTIWNEIERLFGL